MRRAAVLTALVLTATLTSGCSLIGGSGSEDKKDRKVTLVTHDSFAVKDGLLAEFERESGIKVELRKLGDAGALTNQLVLTKASPLGDVAFGVDSTFASRALDEGVFQPYRSPEAGKGPQRYAPKSGEPDRLTAVDVGDVCVNIDTGYFAQRGLAEPRTLADLADPKYRDLFVVEDPSTSSPGLAFLFSTVAALGDSGWAEYWGKLKANGVKAVSNWETAYTQEFSAAAGKGPRPIVVSYASSPAAEVGPDGKPRTKALLDTCYRQVEYAGVVKGTKDAASAGKLVDFLLSEKFQSQVSEQMYVYPAREGVALPESWKQAAPQPERSAALSDDQVKSGRERWITQWRTLVQG